MKSGRAVFVTGIDTGIGKTFATGLLARQLVREGVNVTTMKLVQTGGEGVSEDLSLHRKVMGVDLSQDDLDGLTCPYVFRFPASPHLAAALENRVISFETLSKSIEVLKAKHDWVLIEGAGGILVPLTDDRTTLDFVAEERLPTLVVTSARLGSINHTLLTLTALRDRGIKVLGLLFNRASESVPEIFRDTPLVLRRFFPELPIVEIPEFDQGQPPEISLEGLGFTTPSTSPKP